MVHDVHVLWRHEFRLGRAMYVANFEISLPWQLFPRFWCGHFSSHISKVFWNRNGVFGNEIYFAIPLDRMQLFIKILLVVSSEVLGHNFKSKSRYCLLVHYPIKVGVNVIYTQFIENFLLPLNFNLFECVHTPNTIKKIDAFSVWFHFLWL